MTSLLYGIIVSALLSTTSLIVVLFRASPLTSPAQALPAFFVSVFLTISTVGALALYAFWKYLPLHTWDAGKLLSVSVRQAVFIASAVVILLFLHLLQILTWWIAILVIGLFVIIEWAINS
jgi:hypothetical protein